MIRENIDLGRPSRVSLLFPTRLTRRTPPPRFGYRTRVITEGVNPSLHVEYKRSHVKQYFKLDRALRTETTINDPRDFGTTKALKNLDYLRKQASRINRTLLQVERLNHNCTLSQQAFDRLLKPALVDNQGVPSMRFGDPRVMALSHALSSFDLIHSGFRNHQLRAHVAALLGLSLDQYSAGRMTYDLRRVWVKGLIARVADTNRYVVTTYGLRVSLFCSKLFLRILRPAWPALLDNASDPIPRPLRAAYLQLDKEIHRLCLDAKLRPAA